MQKKPIAVKKQSVRGSTSGRPIMALLDLLGRRWSLRIIWELRDDRSLTSRALRTACDEASPTVLQARLSELREAGFVELNARQRLSPHRVGKGPVRKFPAAASVCGAMEQTALSES